MCLVGVKVWSLLSNAGVSCSETSISKLRRSLIAQFWNLIHNFEIGTQFSNWQNVQCNFKIAKKRKTELQYTVQQPYYAQLISQSWKLQQKDHTRLTIHQKIELLDKSGKTSYSILCEQYVIGRLTISNIKKERSLQEYQRKLTDQGVKRPSKVKKLGRDEELEIGGLLLVQAKAHDQSADIRSDPTGEDEWAAPTNVQDNRWYC